MPRHPNGLKSLFTMLATASVFTAVLTGHDGGLAQSIEDIITPVNPDAQAIRQACASPRPLLVVDTFATRQAEYGAQQSAAKEIDLDGDFIPNVAHGDFVAKVAALSGKRVMAYGLPSLDDGGSIDRDILFDSLLTLTGQIQSGVIEKPAAIILSYELRTTINNLN